MFLGHYAVALGSKRAAPRTSLGTLVLAAQLADEVWPVLLLLGIERVRIEPGLMAASPLDFVHYPFTHSLLFAVLWGLLLGLVYLGIRRDRRGALVVGSVVVSHWFLDVIVHRPDLPLWPGSGMRVGLGLWNSMAATLVLEGGFFALGVWLYARTTRAVDGVGRWGFVAMVAFLAVAYLAAGLGPPPPDVRTLAVSGLALWIFVPWSYWVDRHRELR